MENHVINITINRNSTPENIQAFFDVLQMRIETVGFGIDSDTNIFFENIETQERITVLTHEEGNGEEEEGDLEEDEDDQLEEDEDEQEEEERDDEEEEEDDEGGVAFENQALRQLRELLLHPPQDLALPAGMEAEIQTNDMVLLVRNYTDSAIRTRVKAMLHGYRLYSFRLESEEWSEQSAANYFAAVAERPGMAKYLYYLGRRVYQMLVLTDAPLNILSSPFFNDHNLKSFTAGEWYNFIQTLIRATQHLDEAPEVEAPEGI